MFLSAYHATGKAGERTGQLLGAYLNGKLGYLPEELKSEGEKNQEETVQVFGKYKTVAKKVRPVLGTTPEEFRIERNIIGDPLKDMPPLNPNPPEFRPTGRYTEECKQIIDKAHQGEFLWPEEHIDLNPEHRPLNAVMAQRIFQGWEQQHEADLEEDFDDLGPQNDIPSEDDLKYVDSVQQRPAEQLDPPLDVPLGPQDDISSNDDLEYVDPVQQRPAQQIDPPLDVPLGLYDDIPSDNDLKYVDPVQQRPAEQLDPLLDVPLGPQDDIPSDDDLDYVDPVQQRPAEDLDPAPPNHPAGLQNPAEQPPLELLIPPELGPIQPI
ncbi:hypothetical protein J132_06939 [Termitomyces sp. J132]|nr:hypothetical protein J132_06939 [Termitomyces sp. J132]